MTASAQLISAPALIGTAGWSIPTVEKHRFAKTGSALERYAAMFSAVEINSSFYRAHRPATYAKWSAATPCDFRFSVKMPKQISHVAKLQDCTPELDRFLTEVSYLNDKLGCLLLQLPPSLEFQPPMERFFEYFRRSYHGNIALEVRHRDWLEPAAMDVIQATGMSLVDADPAPAGLGVPGGQPFLYLRLHGTPKTYYSAYTDLDLERYAARLARPITRWCIFDNTALGAAIGNALALQALVLDRSNE